MWPAVLSEDMTQIPIQPYHIEVLTGQLEGRPSVAARRSKLEHLLLRRVATEGHPYSCAL